MKKIIQELTHICVNIKLGTYHGNITFSQVKNVIFQFNEIMNKANINMNPYVLIKLAILDVLGSKEEAKKHDFSFLDKKIQEKEEVLSLKNDVAEKTELKSLETSKNDEVFENLKKIRVNNCFCGARKESLIQYQEIWKELGNNLNIKPDIIALILDSSLVAASKDYCIIMSKLSSTANLINARLEEFTQ